LRGGFEADRLFEDERLPVKFEASSRLMNTLILTPLAPIA
jgi:hypothetical protein